MNDIAPELLKKIQMDFDAAFDKSDVIKKLYARIRDGTATYVDANEFAVEVGDILTRAYKHHISADVLPGGRMYYNIAERVIGTTMKINYELISGVAGQIQETLNKTAKIGIKPVVPELNQDRIDGIVNKVSSADNYEDVEWVLDEPIKTFSQSIVDDSIRVNAEFHAKAGMQPVIVRKIAGNCCEWCKAVAGTYKYPDEVPKDVYRRHQRCRCTVDYNPKNGKIQNVHSKKWRDENEEIILEERKAIGLKDSEKEKRKRINETKEVTAKDLDKMSLKELRELATETATQYYESGISGISFGGANVKKAAEALANSGSRFSLKKDILSMQKKMKDGVANNGKSSTIKLADTLIHKSVGAKARNYEILDPATGEVFQFAEGTRIQNSEVFAGRGTKKPLHEGVAEGLAEQMGGKPENWQHCKGNGIIDYYGEERPAEVHWFQEESVGKVKFKVKEWKDEN